MFDIDSSTASVIYAISLMISIVVCIVLAVYIWRRRPARGTGLIACLMASMALWTAAYLLQILSPTISGKLFFANIALISKMTMPIIWMVFALKYSRLEKLITPAIIGAISIIPLVSIIAAWTNNWHGLIWSSIAINYAYPIDVLTLSKGILFWVSGAYAYLLMIVGAIIIIKASIQKKELDSKVIILITSITLPLIVKAVLVFIPGMLNNLDITPLVFTLCWCMVCWYAFRYRLLDLVPIARDALVEQLNDAVLVVDMDGSLLYCNKAAREKVTLEQALTIGKPVTGLLPCCSDINGRICNNQVITLQYGNGTPEYFEMNTTEINDQDNNPGGYLINLRNVTERIMHEEQLKIHREHLEELVKERTASLSRINIELQKEIAGHKKAESQLRMKNALIDRILANTPNAVAVVGSNMQILLANNVFCRTFSLKKDKIVGKSVIDAFPIEDWVDKISRVLLGIEPQLRFEFKHKVADQDRIIIANLINMQVNEVLLIMVDITEERERQEKMYFTDRLASIGQIAAGIAHELNNPLTCIISLSQLLLEDGIPEEIKEELNTICGEAQRAGSIVRGLLAFSRRQVSIRQPVQINDVLWDVLKLRAYEHKSKNIRVITEFAPGLPEVLADRLQMQQVCMNIIVNAEDAMTECRNRGTLSIITKHIDHSIKISFTDDGSGIPEHNLNRIFEPFFTTKSMGKGTGLGLSICYGIVTKHNGKIYPQSKSGKGTTFIIELPLETSSNEQVENNDLYTMEESAMAI